MEAQHEPVQPYLINPMMEQLLREYEENNDHIVTKLARLHMEFKIIHLFVDGNGKIGRLLVNLELMKVGYPLMDFKLTNRLFCYNAFDKYYSKYSLKTWRPATALPAKGNEKNRRVFEVCEIFSLSAQFSRK